MSDSVLSCKPLIYQTSQPLVTSAVTTTFTNSSNKRVKVTLACVVCRKKKVKCDGIQPTCSRCDSMGFSCQYSDPPKKRGPPKGQVEIIESRAHRIESLRVSARNHDHKISSSGSSAQRMNSIMDDDYIAGNDNGIINSRVNSSNISNGDRKHYNIILSLISGAIDSVQANDWKMSSQDTPGSHYLKNDFLMKDDPMVSDYQKWTACFFGYFNIFFPILSQPHFMRQLSEQRVDPLLFYAVCAMGSKFSDNDQEVSGFLFERCQCILNSSRDTAMLPTVQALVILCWYSYLLGNMQTCCELRHHLIQAANDLQLCRDPGSSLGIVCIEMRRRAFWVTFVTDQWLSCFTGERLLISQDHWNCRWPQLEDSQLLAIDRKQWKSAQQNGTSYQTATDMLTSDTSHLMPDLSAEFALQITAFSEMIKLANIVNDMHNLYSSSSSSNCSTPSINQPIIVSRLTDWLLRLPPYLEYGKPRDDSPPSPIARIYHMFYYTVQIMLHQPYLRLSSLNTEHTSELPLSADSSLPDSIMARTICSNAANTITHIAEQLIQHNQNVYLYNTLMTSLTLAASIHLENVLNVNQDYSVSFLLNLSRSLKVLQKCNCSLLAPVELKQLLDRFLLDRYGIRLDDNKEQNQDQKGTLRRSPSQLKRRVMTSANIDFDYDHRAEAHPRKRRSSSKGSSSLRPLAVAPKNTPSLSSVSPHSSTYSLSASASTSTQTISSSTSVPFLCSPTIITWYNRDDKDDLLDTRLHNLLSDRHICSSSSTDITKSSPTISNSTSPTTLDPIWLDETSSIFDVFPDSSTITATYTASPVSSSPQVQPSSPSSPSCSMSVQSQAIMTPTEALHSPSSLVSPTQSPTLSSDSHPPTMTTPISHLQYYSFDKDPFKPLGQPFYPPPADAMELYAFMSDATFTSPL